MKKTLGLLLVFSMLLSALCFSASAAEPKDGKTAVKTLVAIGDSIASGYMLPDYDPQIDRPRTSTAAPVLLAKEIGYDFIDMTKEGSTTKNVLENQFSEEYEEYVIDPETMWFIKGPDGKRLSYTFDNRQNLERLKTADIVTVSVGNYDLVSFFSLEDKIFGALDPDKDISIFDIIALLGDVWDEIDTKTTESAQNLRGVFNKIREFNPDVTIAFQNLYNTYQQVNVTEVQMFVRFITEILNKKTKTVCEDMDIMYVDVYTKFDEHKNEDLINMDCPTREDYENKNYQNDSHPTLLGHRYIMETYYEAFEQAGIFIEYEGAEVEKSYSFTRNEAYPGLNEAMPEKIVLNTTDGDYYVSVENWKTDKAIDYNSTSTQELKVTAVLDDDTVPDYIRNVKEISATVTITGTFVPPATTAPSTTRPVEDTEAPADIENDDETTAVNDTDVVLDEQTNLPQTENTQIQESEKDTNSDADADTDAEKDTEKDPYESEVKEEYRTGDNKLKGALIIGGVILIGITVAVVGVSLNRRRS